MSQSIVRLEVNNILRITAAEIKPDGSLIIVAGKNDQGKSSLLNSIALALAGKGDLTQPIHDGAAKGTIILETEELIVKRSFSESGSMTLEVKNRQGGVIQSPQTMLNTLYNRTTFDPLTFTRLKPDDQAETLRKLAGLDFTDADKAYDTLFNERTEKNRAVKAKAAQVAALTRHEGVPAEEVKFSDLAQKLADAQAHNQGIERKRDELSDANDAVDDAVEAVNRAAMRVDQIKAQLDSAEKELTAAQHSKGEFITKRDALSDAFSKLEEIDTAPILAEMQSAEDTNAKVRANLQWNAERKALTTLESEAADMTKRLAKMENDKNDKIRKAKFPIEGLGLKAAGVTFEGHPFEQISSSKQIRVSLAIASALNPELRIMLIRDGSLLDEDSLELVSKFAEENKCQVFMEAVGNREDATVIIEDGTVVATPKATKAAKRK